MKKYTRVISTSFKKKKFILARQAAYDFNLRFQNSFKINGFLFINRFFFKKNFHNTLKNNQMGFCKNLKY